MKRTFYISLMMLFFIMITVSLYFCTIYCLVIYRIVPLRSIITFTDLMLSREVYVFVVCIGALLGYMMGRRWWQIIYVDRVYYFDRPKARTRTKKITKKGELSA